MSANYIRPFSAAWYRNMHKQGQQLTTDNVTGFPELTAVSGIPDWSLTSSFPANAVAYKGGALFRANSAISANTPFVEGTGANEWTNVTEAATNIAAHDVTKIYNKDEPMTYNGIVYRAKADDTSGAFVAGQWDRLTNPPMRVFLAAGSPDSVVLDGFKSQEIIFESDRTIGSFEFKNGDRILFRKDVNGTIVADDFYYFPISQAEVPVPPTGSSDEVYVGTIPSNPDINIFYVFDPGFDYIQAGLNVADKITWDVTATPTAGYTIKKIEWYRASDDETLVLSAPGDFTIDGTDRTKFMLQSSGIGPEADDIFTVTFSAP
jgi:hypothetical protein